jgi:hypothetical protein
MQTTPHQLAQPALYFLDQRVCWRCSAPGAHGPAGGFLTGSGALTTMALRAARFLNGGNLPHTVRDVHTVAPNPTAYNVQAPELVVVAGYSGLLRIV